jgi:multiple sugar transport system ATP-binding protein
VATVRYDKATRIYFVVRVDSRHAPQLGDIVHVKPRVGAHHAFHALSGEQL